MTLLQLLRQQILDYDNYNQDLINIIGYPGYPHTDCKVKDIVSFSEWISSYQTYPVIKIEGIEKLDPVKRHFNNISVKNIHLFINQKFGYSFNWHRDNINVLLYVLSGKKTLYIRDKVFEIYPKQYAIIPKGHLHKVRSIDNTWALSVGF